MDKTIGLPEWFSRDLTSASEDVVPLVSSVIHIDGEPYFTGAIAEFVKAYKIPNRIDVALDMDQWACVARLEFAKGGDGRGRDRGWRALYAWLDVEGFALLWNSTSTVVNGLVETPVHLGLRPNDESWPTTVGGEQADIAFVDGRFRIAPHLVEEKTQ